jgi:hypothetical protein
MLEFSDKGYRYFESKPNRLAGWMLRCMNRRLYLPGKKHRIDEVVIENPQVVADAVEQAGHRLLLLPNHPTHSDPQIMVEVFRQLKLPASFMAAYDVFLRSKLTAWCMQKMGCFSVDREGSDRASMKEAIQILKKGQRALTIFPEGNVYLTNDRVTPFLEGPAFIGLKAQKDIGADSPVLALPVSIKVTHLTDVRSQVQDRLRELATDVGTHYDPSVDSVMEVKRLGLLALRKVMSGLARSLPEDVGEGLPAFLQGAASGIIGELEEQIALDPKKESGLIDRIRMIRRKIHSLRIAETQALADFKARTLAADAILAYRLLTYPGTYLKENPSLDRMSETVEKVLEDLRSETIPPFASRRAVVLFGEPIDLAEQSKSAERGLTSRLTDRFEAQVQSGLDSLNLKNECPGSAPFAPESK